MKQTRFYFSILFWSIALMLSAQTSTNVQETVDTTKAEKVILEYSNMVQSFQENGEEVRYLKGEVEFRQGSTFMSCDTAILYVLQNNLIAYGNVLIQQGDSLSIYADSLSYLGNDKIADLFGNVSLTNKGKQLFTERMRYNLKTKVATYYTGATLTVDSTQLTSRRGYYYVDLDEAYFKDTVFVVNEKFSMVCDTLKYNLASKIATFLGPTRIDQNKSKIYCEDGFYNTETRNAKLYNNAQFIKEDQQGTSDTIIYDGVLKEIILKGHAKFKENDKRAEADQIIYEEQSENTRMEGNAIVDSETQHIESEIIVYNKQKESYNTTGRSTVLDGSTILNADNINFDDKNGLGHATGNVIWVDTSENITIVCEEADYNKETDYILARGGRPLLISMVDGDSLFMTSDTLVSLRANPGDSLRTLLAYKDVRIFKSDLQGICDSLVYSTADSVFHFYQNPIIWSDSTQFMADTMQIQLANKKMDKIFLQDKSFIINSPDEILFNQIKGKQITAFFKEENLARMDVEGSAETIYYILDEEDAYVGMNKTICSEMILYFGNNKIETIHYYNKPTGNYIPLDKVDQGDYFLEGFKWEIKNKPKSLEDLFDNVTKPRPEAVMPAVILKEGTRF
ncbi:MAG: lipopolysaccharide export system protein LptA [Saprospiraceae bacterium]|jgi:lipopolysaccharide export system protein LptA